MSPVLLGELAALLAAFFWAGASLLFHRLGRSIPPLALNLHKGLLAGAGLGLVVLLRQEALPELPLASLAWLAFSGTIGIGIGDTAFFAALNRLGERRTVLMAETLAPPMATALAFLLLAEVLPPLAFLGIALTLGGVAWVIIEQTPSADSRREPLKAGILYGLLAALCQSLGAVISRGVLVETEIGFRWSALIRIAGGLVVLVFWLPLRGQSLVPRAMCSLRIWPMILLAAFFGTFLGIGLQQFALERAPAGIAQTLLATSSLFVLPLVALRGEKVSPRAVFGALLAVAGVSLLFLA